MGGHWVDIDSSRIADDEPPKAEIGVALRARDHANATKVVPHTSTPSGSTTSETWTDLLTWQIYVPDDIPDDGAVLAWPVQVKVTVSSGAPNSGEYRLKLGSSYSDAIVTVSTSYEHHVLTVAVDTSLRGSEEELVLQARVPGNDPLDPPTSKTHAYASSADEAHRCLASIRSS